MAQIQWLSCNFMLEKGIYVTGKRRREKKEIYDSIVFPFEYGELITCICFFIIILRFKLCHRQKETWKWWDWQDSMNSLIWISFINSSSHTGKELACFAKSELE